MIHLHQLLEQSNVGCYVDPTHNNHGDHLIQVLTRMREERDKIICFYAGECDAIASLKRVPGLLRLPFPTCWVEAVLIGEGGEHLYCGIYAFEKPEERQTYCCAFHRIEKNKWAYLGDLSWNWDGKEEVYRSDGPTELFEYQYYWFASFLTAVNCNNVKRIKIEPSQQLQRARIRKGKVPMAAYYTLHLGLTPEQQASEEKGQQYSGRESPRLHPRRGHARQYLPGKWCWVQHTMVGTKERGIIIKDYSI